MAAEYSFGSISFVEFKINSRSLTRAPPARATKYIALAVLVGRNGRSPLWRREWRGRTKEKDGGRFRRDCGMLREEEKNVSGGNDGPLKRHLAFHFMRKANFCAMHRTASTGGVVELALLLRQRGPQSVFELSVERNGEELGAFLRCFHYDAVFITRTQSMERRRRNEQDVAICTCFFIQPSNCVSST